MAHNANAMRQRGVSDKVFDAAWHDLVVHSPPESGPDNGQVVPTWLRTLPFVRQKVARGKTLYRAGDPSENVYVVRYGTFKTVKPLANARQCITSFVICGDVMGLDSVGDGNCTASAVALEDSETNVIPYGELLSGILRDPLIATHLQRHMTREMASGMNEFALLRESTAEQRVAFFMLNLAARLSAHGYSPTRFTLRMNRTEIASYLALSNETVSRVISRLMDANLIDIRQRKEVCIKDADALRALIWGDGFPYALLPAVMRSVHS